MNPGSEFATPLWHEVERYIEAKKAKGCRFDAETRRFRRFYRYLRKARISRIRQVSPEVVDGFFEAHGYLKNRSYNVLLSTISGLFRWLEAQARIDLSPVRLKSRTGGGVRSPYLFDRKMSRSLLAQARQLPDRNRAPLRGPTYEMIFALLRGLGLRETEAARLRIEDIDLKKAILVVREGKFGKERIVPFGPKMKARLTSYLSLRLRNGPAAEGFMFTFDGVAPVSATAIRRTFASYLVPRLGPMDGPRPVVHDLRHSFAVGTLASWYRTGVDPRDRLEDLSALLGHVNVQATSVYLTVTRELLGAAQRRSERYASIVLKGAVLK